MISNDLLTASRRSGLNVPSVSMYRHLPSPPPCEIGSWHVTANVWHSCVFPVRNSPNTSVIEPVSMPPPSNCLKMISESISSVCEFNGTISYELPYPIRVNPMTRRQFQLACDGIQWQIKIPLARTFQLRPTICPLFHQKILWSLWIGNKMNIPCIKFNWSFQYHNCVLIHLHIEMEIAVQMQA